MKNFVFSGPLPVGTRAHDLEKNQVERRLYESFLAVTEYINNHGGFELFMWVKRGELLDQGVDQPGGELPHNVVRTTVESGTLNYHITWMEPMTPQGINLDQLDPLKFDVSNGFQH